MFSARQNTIICRRMDDLMSFLKTIIEVDSEQKAKDVVEDLKTKGYTELAIVHPNVNNKKYSISAFDEGGFDFFDGPEMENPNIKRCLFCGKTMAISRFFRCFNCDTWECYDCGMNRLFHNEIPAAHQCGRDNYEFLAGIGPCVKCGELMGFKSVPIPLRMRMLAKVPIMRMKIMTGGLLACFSIEREWLEKEIMKTFTFLQALVTNMESERSSQSEWMKLYITANAYLRRMYWATSYLTEVSDPQNRRLRFYPTQAIDGIGYIQPLLLFVLSFHKYIVDVIEGKITESVFQALLGDMNMKIANASIDHGLYQIKKPMAQLVDIGKKIRDPRFFHEYAPVLCELIMINEMARFYSDYRQKSLHLLIDHCGI